MRGETISIRNNALLLTIFMILFLAIGSVCAADLNNDSNVNSEILNSKDINSNGINLEANSLSVSDAPNNDLNVSNVDLVSNKSNVLSANAVSSVTVDEVVNASKTVVSYVDSNKVLPTSIKVGSYTVTAAQFSYLASMAVQNIKNGKLTTKINIPSYSARNSAGDKVSISLSTASAVSYAKVLTDYAINNGILPGTITISGKKVEFKVYTYAYANMLKSYASSSALPSSVLFSSSVYENTTPVSTTNVTIAQIMSAAVSLKSYVEKNKALPSSVSVGSISVGIGQFAYLESAAIKLLNSKKSTSTKVSVINVSSSSYTTSVKKTISMSAYLTGVNSVYSACSSKNAAPDYVTMSSSKVDFRTYTFGFAKILAFYKTNSRLPNTCLFDSSVFANTPTPTTNVTIAQIMSAAVSLKSYVEKNKALPSSVSVGSISVGIGQFAYLESAAIKLLNSKKSTSTKVSVINVSSSSYTTSVKKTISMSAYLTGVNSVYSACSSKNAAPDYVTMSSSKVDFRTYTFGFAKILAFYKTNSRLPNTCLFDSSVFKTVTQVSIAQIITAAASLKSSVESNKELPNTVTVGGVTVTSAQFAYLESAAIKLLEAKSSNSTMIEVINVSGSSATYEVCKTIGWSYCLSLANSVANSCVVDKAVPSYVTVDSAKIDFRDYTYGFAKILNYYKNNGVFPASCLFNSSVFNTPSVTVAQVIAGAVSLKSYVETNKKLPNTVTVGGKAYAIAEFSYLQSEAVKLLANGKSTSTKIPILTLTNGSVTYTFDKTLSKTEFVDWANSLSKYCVENGRTPNYLYYNSSNADFRTYTYGFAKILAFYNTNSRLPNSCEFDSSVFSGGSGKYQKGINELNTETDLSKYLVATGHCALNTEIKNLAASLTKDCKTTLEKATAIFNYVRDKISYQFYANSQKDASGALSSKKANCCDKSNLIVALCRASGIYARYCHAKCPFTSGNVYGHVWAQILVDGVWYCADATSSYNKLGQINNWKTSSMTGLSQMAQLTF